jgi:hypothetical protein
MDTDNIEILKSICPTDSQSQIKLLLDYLPDAGFQSVQIHILRENLMKCLKWFMKPALLFWKA